MKKRLISALISIIMILSLIPLSAFAGGGYYGSCGAHGSDVNWRFDNSTGTLVISGKGAMKDYSSSSAANRAPWYEIRDRIFSVRVEEGVTLIGDSAFYGCMELSSVILPGTLRTVGYFAFAQCASLYDVDLPDSITRICNRAFYGTGVYNDISLWEGRALYVGDCLISVKSSVFDGFSIKDGTRLIAEDAFSGCVSLTAVYVPASVKYIGDDAFSGCLSLASVYIDGGVKEIGDCVFSECAALSVLSIDGVTTIGEEAFNLCDSLENLIIPKTVEFIDEMAFSDCVKLKTVTIPVSVTEIGDDAFDGCDSVTDVYYGGTRSQWNKLVIGVGNDAIEDANVHFSHYLHTFDEIDETAAECGSAGFAKGACSVCGVTFVYETEHVSMHDFSDATTEPTCTEKGYTTFTCSICGKVRDTEFVDALGHDWGEYDTYPATCEEDGMYGRVCLRCGARDPVEVYPAFGHTWSEWTTARLPDPANYPDPGEVLDGISRRVCSVCGGIEEQPIKYFEGHEYLFIINNTENINYIRIAPGALTTAAEIKSAPGLIQLGAKQIAEYVSDGVFSYELEPGEYSAWIKYNDGGTYIISGFTNTEMTPCVKEVYGLYATVGNLYNVSILRIAKGHYTDAADVKENAMVTQTARYLGGAHEYTALVDEPGEYTLWTSFSDDREPVFEYFVSEVTVPEYEQEGMWLNISGLDDITNLRYATGTYNSTSEIKHAPDVCTLSPRKALKNVTEYTFRFMKEGDYTFIIQYNNGYCDVRHVRIKRIRPMVFTGAHSVTFRGLTGFKLGVELDVIRYVYGTYSSRNKVKTITGNAFIKPAALEGANSYTFDGLKGPYTFVVQYTDGSVNVYNIDFEKQ